MAVSLERRKAVGHWHRALCLDAAAGPSQSTGFAELSTRTELATATLAGTSGQRRRGGAAQRESARPLP